MASTSAASLPATPRLVRGLRAVGGQGLQVPLTHSTLRALPCFAAVPASAALSVAAAFAGRWGPSWRRRTVSQWRARIRRFGCPCSSRPRKKLLRPETAISHAPIPLRTDDLHILSGISELIQHYDAFALDQYGVMHDGRNAYPGASDCLASIKAAGKPSVILSNYAGRSARQRDRLPGIGFNPDDLAGIVTSGELAHRYLTKNKGKLGTRVLWIAWAEREKRGLGDFFAELEGYTLASRVEEADFILVSGVESLFAGTKVETNYDYERDGNHRHFRPTFRAAIQRSLPMLCANPDLRVVRPGGWHAYLGGSLARLYKELGGRVIYFGKPYTQAFEEARRLLCLAAAGGDEAKAADLELDEGFRICHVGDSLHHDVAGAQGVGLDAAFVAKTGLHAGDMGGPSSPITKDGVRQLCQRQKVPLPQAVVPRFTW